MTKQKIPMGYRIEWKKEPIDLAILFVALVFFSGTVGYIFNIHTQITLLKDYNILGKLLFSIVSFVAGLFFVYVAFSKRKHIPVLINEVE